MITRTGAARQSPPPSQSQPASPPPSKSAPASNPMKHSFSSRGSSQHWKKWGASTQGSQSFGSSKGGASSGYKNLGKGASDLMKKAGIAPKVSGQVSGRAAVGDARWSGQTSGDWGSASTDVSVSVLEVAASASGEAGVNGLNAYAQGGVSASANLFHAKAKGHVKVNGVGELNYDASVRVGADGSIQGRVDIGVDGVRVQGRLQAFAGVSAQASGQLKTDFGLGASGSIGVKAGIGIEGNIDIGFKDGKLNFKLDFGVALGIGFSFSIEINIDFKQVGKAIGDFFSKLFGGKPGNKTIDLAPLMQMMQQTDPNMFNDFVKTLDQAADIMKKQAASGASASKDQTNTQPKPSAPSLPQPPAPPASQPQTLRA